MLATPLDPKCSQSEAIAKRKAEWKGDHWEVVGRDGQTLYKIDRWFHCNCESVGTCWHVKLVVSQGTTGQQRYPIHRAGYHCHPTSPTEWTITDEQNPDWFFVLPDSGNLIAALALRTLAEMR